MHAGSTGAEAALTPAQAATLTEPRAQQAGVAAGRLDGKLIGVLQVALLDSFTLDTMRQMTRIYLDESLDAIAGDGDFSGVTFSAASIRPFLA